MFFPFRFYIIVFWSIFLPFITSGQEKYPVFPDDWLGNWEGQLFIFKNQDVVQKVPMRLDIHPTDSLDIFMWVLTYGADSLSMKRDYKLKPVDKSRGLWIIDEQNSILLESKVMANSFVSVFSVEKSTLISKVSIEKKELMIFEILVHGKEASGTTGNTLFKGEMIPEVLAYTVTGYQRAELKKVK